ncbi:hypothetical protein KAR91_27230 [Candidatus Pacearchaeota archaeon]|nr:hypothetical protein [Candidatus Pacearchaeota archaeon]
MHYCNKCSSYTCKHQKEYYEDDIKDSYPTNYIHDYLDSKKENYPLLPLNKPIFYNDNPIGTVNSTGRFDTPSSISFKANKASLLPQDLTAPNPIDKFYEKKSTLPKHDPFPKYEHKHIDLRTCHMGPAGMILDMGGCPTGLTMNPLGNIMPT